MTGGIVQLSLWGAEDVVLSSQAQITYFKHVFRRATPFSLDAVEQNFQGEADFGRKASVTIGRSGDLLTEVWLQIRLPPLADYSEPYTQLADRPVIKMARYTTPTTARIVIVSSTSAKTIKPSPEDPEYQAILTDGDGVEHPQTFNSLTNNKNTIRATGLDPEKQYTVIVTMKDTQAVNSNLANYQLPSQKADVIALKWVNSIGHAIIESVEIEVGGSRIDRHTSDFLDIWSELTIPEEKRRGFNEMIGKFDDYDDRSDMLSIDKETLLFVPLQFFFNTSPGMALPVVALTYHETRLNFQFREYKELLHSSPRSVNFPLMDNTGQPLALKELKCYGTFVYLDVLERRKYSSAPHEFLITVLQFLGDAAVNVQEGDAPTRKIPMDFSHPVKEVLWVYQPFNRYSGNDTTERDWFDYGKEDFFQELYMTVNGHQRMSPRPAAYWRLCQPYAHHTRVPSKNKNIYLYSYALFPENINASGSLNMSRCDSSQMVITFNPGKLLKGRLRIYARSFNVLRIASGMGGLSFSG
jgi:hypothetical protein